MCIKCLAEGRSILMQPGFEPSIAASRIWNLTHMTKVIHCGVDGIESGLMDDMQKSHCLLISLKCFRCCKCLGCYSRVKCLIDLNTYSWRQCKRDSDDVEGGCGVAITSFPRLGWV